MREPSDDLSLRRSLRLGLHALPVPAVTPDFDARVLAALHTPQPWWRPLWEPARPLLLGASCSLALTLLALHWTLSAPVTPPSLRAAPPALASTPAPLPSLDALLDRPDLRAGSLAAWAALPPLPPPDRRPAPPRHAQVGRRACLIV